MVAPAIAAGNTLVCKPPHQNPLSSLMMAEAYDLLPRGGQWAVYDILVDDASQVQTYRQSFKKILDKEGWPGLMTRMRKAAEKKVG